VRTLPTPLQVNKNLLQKTARTSMATQLYKSPSVKSASTEQLPANRIIVVLAGTASWYKVALTDGKEGFVEGKTVSELPYKKQTLKTATLLLDQPELAAAVKTTLPAGAGVQLMGKNDDFYYIVYGEMSGWVKISGQTL
jgi:uncharacterized protein YgiM (DUF1202 family)